MGRIAKATLTLVNDKVKKALIDTNIQLWLKKNKG